jgi:hypothetical protein
LKPDFESQLIELLRKKSLTTDAMSFLTGRDSRDVIEKLKQLEKYDIVFSERRSMNRWRLKNP